jgi:diacylglycerol kinase (ATP)
MTEPPTDSDERRPDGDKRRGGDRLETEVFYPSPFTVMGRARSFRHAFMGIWFVLRSQHNAWLHAAASVLALVLAGVLHVNVRAFTTGEWADLVIAIVLVWVAETFNTGLEVLANAVTGKRHPVLKIAKDVAAAAVLMAAVGALVVGLILFVPRFVELFERWGGPG